MGGVVRPPSNSPLDKGGVPRPQTRPTGPAQPRTAGVSIPERLLARLWEKRATRQKWFRASGGRRVRVIYPGRSSSDAGPDFRDALLKVEGVGLVRGDVELHLRQQDWQGHGHQEDPRYNSVVLHAALDPLPSTTSLPGGRQVPTISLSSLLHHQQDSDYPPAPALWEVLEGHGFSRPACPEEMAGLLDRAGDVRFLDKSSRFRRYLAEQSPEQALYESLMEALGYRHNQQPFRELAARAPYQVLRGATNDVSPGLGASMMESWLIRLSGLAPQEATPGEKLPRGLGPPLEQRQWRCFRVRPANHPLRRLAGAARLLARFAGPGLVSGLGAIAGESLPQALTRALTVASPVKGEGAYIGGGRARDLAVNVVLPFYHALAVSQGDWGEGHPYLALYRQFGKLADNGPTREMAAQLLGPELSGLVNAARRQQGLLHLHRLARGEG